MKNKFHSIFGVIFLCISSFAFAQKEEPFLPTLAPVLTTAMPAIVNVAVQGIVRESPSIEDQESQRSMPPGAEKPRKFHSIGSGVIIDPEHGVILTNDHVIRNATLITVTLNDGRRLEASLIGGDSATDIAVLKIDAQNLKSIPVGDSDLAQVGDFVIAIGNPFGLNSIGNSQSATFGIISAMKRSDLNIEGIENFIQTDAAINPGNSGGALVNTKGELIGINTAIISLYGGSVGIGFAIPINMAKNVAEQIIKYGSVHRGLMGIFVQHLTPELAQAMGYPDSFKGALVSQVNEHSPAEVAGLKAGDVIFQVNDTKITQASQVRTTVSLLRAGSKARIKVKRKDSEMIFKVVVTDVKDHEQKLQSKNPFLYGLALSDFEQDSPMHGRVVGVQVVGASEISAGWRAGLRPGDIIINANNKPTKTTSDLQSIAQKNKKQLLVQVLRGSGALYILII
jgi:serine protease Do